MRLPKEHGVWAMLYVPFVLGAVVGVRSASALVPVLLVCLAATCLYVAREELLALWRLRRRGASALPNRALVMELLLGLASALVLVLAYRQLALVPLGMLGLIVFTVNFVQVIRREGRSMLGEMLGILGLTMTAPAADIAARGEGAGFTSEGLWLWLLCALYFASSVFHVKLRVLYPQPRKAEARRGMRLRSAAYHVALLALLGALIAARQLHLWVLVAFVPILARALWSVSRPAQHVDLTRAGLLEVAYSLHFLLFTAIAFRL